MDIHIRNKKITMKLFSQTIALLLILFGSSQVLAQNVSISGPTLIKFGETETYSVQDPNGEIVAGSIEWSCDGSIQGSSSSSSIDVVWDIEGQNMVELCYEDASANEHCISIQVIVYYISGNLTAGLGTTSTYSLVNSFYVNSGSIDWSTDGVIQGANNSSSVEIFWDSNGLNIVEVCFEDPSGNSFCISEEVSVSGPSLSGMTSSELGDVETYTLHDPNNQVKAGTIVWSSGGIIQEAGNSSSADVLWDIEGANTVEVCYEDDFGITYCLEENVMVSQGIHVAGASGAKIGDTGAYTLEDPNSEIKAGTIIWSSAGVIQGSSNAATVNVFWNDEGNKWVKVCYEDINDVTHCIIKVVGVSGEQNVYMIGPSTPKLGAIDTYTLVDPDNQVNGGIDWSSDGVIQGARNNPTVDILWDSEGANIIELCYLDNFGNSFCIHQEVVVSTVPTVTAESLNHIHTTVPKTLATNVSSLANDEKSESRIYYDGLGREKQSVVIRGGSASEDVVTHFEYDDFGRQAKKYLPFPETSNGGEYRTEDLATATQQYYLNNYPGDFSGISLPDVNAYVETIFERSPLGRVLEQASPGKDWRVTGGATTASRYETNAASEVKLYEHLDLQVSASTNYSAGELYKVVTTDEDGNETITFTDKRGQVILKKAHTGSEWAETYYIYDERQRLRVVLPPQANKMVMDGLTALSGYQLLTTDQSVTSNGNYQYATSVSVTIDPGTTLTDVHITPMEILSPDFLSDWAFMYEYDERNRMTLKKVPGAEPVYMVYDRWDRLVLTQDGNQRGNDEWLFTKYDELNRPIMTGICTDSRTATTIQEALHVAGYNERNETYNGSGTTKYTNTTFPTDNIQKYLTISYYDNYDFIGGEQYEDHGFTNGTFHLDPELRDQVKGQVTGTLADDGTGTGNMLQSVTYYDSKYRPIQTIADNHLAGTDKISNQYDYVGNLRRSHLTHTASGATTEILREYEYDHADRLVNTWHKIGANPKMLISHNEYSELGELTTKNLHHEGSSSYPPASSFEQNVDYDYNIRGWLTRINDSQLTNGDDLLGMELYYNTSSGLTGHENRYNGNIAAMRWSSYDAENDGISRRAYEFDYDGLNRLTEANHIRNTNTSHAEFDVDVTSYDLNGNIQGLTRKGKNGEEMDNLSYTYEGNQLVKVDDSWDDTEGFTESGSGPDYIYDDNGNMISDANKGITDIDYNHLNLPTKVTFGVDDYIEYQYDAVGMKLQQAVYSEGNLEKTTDYVGEFIYEDLHDGNGRQLQLIQHEEGRIIQKVGGEVTFLKNGSSTSGFSANQNVTISTDGERVKVLSNQSTSTPGAWPIGGTISVTGGQPYTFKVFGYSDLGVDAYLYITTSSASITWSEIKLPEGSSNEGWTSKTFVIPDGDTALKVGILFSGQSVGDAFYVNQAELLKAEYDYQYHLKDHLGNTRLTFSTTPESYSNSASFEDANVSTESEFFGNVNVNRDSHPSTSNTGKATRLNNATPVGTYAVLSVNKGDEIDLSVKGYYSGGSGYSAGIAAATIESTLSTAVQGSQLLEGFASTAIDNGIGAAITALGAGGSNDDNVPGAYLNYLIFDRNMNLAYNGTTPLLGFIQISSAANGSEQTISINDIPIDRNGYLIAYISNESNTTNYVYFDDFKVDQEKTNVVQANDYYPFGLTFNGYQRTASTVNRFNTFQDQERDETTGWIQFKWRNHQPEIGRFFNVDPLAESFYYNSTYAFSENKVTNHIELEGLEAVYAQAEARLSLPLLPNLMGVTASIAYGVAVNIDDGKGMLFQTTSVGTQVGIYGGGGAEFGLFPTGSIDNMKGTGLNFGGSAATTIVAGEPFGPDGGGELNLTVPRDENGSIIYEDIKAGGTIALPVINYSGGITAYGDISNTQSLVEFDINDIFKAIDERSGEIYEYIQNFAETQGFDMKQLIEEFRPHYESWKESKSSDEKD